MDPVPALAQVLGKNETAQDLSIDHQEIVPRHRATERV
jgi:hypothetical protein